MSSAHDGTGKITFMMTPRRTTTQVIQTFKTPILSYKHTKHVHGKLTSAVGILTKVKDLWAEYDASTQAMIRVVLTDVQARGFIERIVGDSDSSQAQNTRAKIFDLWSSVGIGRNIPACQRTLFGLVQAFCEYADHHSVVRKSKYLNEAGATLDSRALGHAAKQKAAGWAFALKLLADRKELSGLSAGGTL
jgi:hypothetical protein